MATRIEHAVQGVLDYLRINQKGCVTFSWGEVYDKFPKSPRQNQDTWMRAIREACESHDLLIAVGTNAVVISLDANYAPAPYDKVSTLKQFLKSCANKSADDIFELFEYGLDDKLKNEIYSYSRSGSPEPFRSACITLGEAHGIQSLINY